MTLLAIYKGHSVEFNIVPGEVVGNSYRYQDRRPDYFVVPQGLSDEEKIYLKDYCSESPRYSRD